MMVFWAPPTLSNLKHPPAPSPRPPVTANPYPSLRTPTLVTASVARQSILVLQGFFRKWFYSAR